MALTPEDLRRVLVTLPSATRKAYEEGKVTDEQLEKYATTAGLVQAKPDFSDVTSGSGSTAPTPRPRSLALDAAEAYLTGQEAVRNSAIAGGERLLGGMGFAGADSDNLPLVTDYRDAAKWAMDKIAGEGTYDAKAEEARQLYGRLYKEGVEDAAGSEEAINSIDNKLFRTGVRAVSDTVGSPSSLGSIPGGPFAAIPAADVYMQEYTDARLAGVSKEDADARAKTQAGIEGLISAIPAGKVLDRIGLGGLGREAASTLANDAIKTGIRTAKTAVGEGLEEGVTTLAQLGADKAFSEYADDETTRRYAESQLPADAVGVFDATMRSVYAGMAGGTALGGPMEHIKTTQERAKMVSDMILANADTRGRLPSEKPAPPPAPGTDLFGQIPQQQEAETEATAVANEGNEQAAKQAQLRTRIGALDSRIAEEEGNLEALHNEKYKSLVSESGETFEKFDEQKIKRTEAWLKQAKNARERMSKQLLPEQQSLFSEMPEQPKNPKFTGEEQPAGVIPTRNPDRYYDANGVIQSRALERTRADAATAIEEDKAEQEKLRVQSYEKTRSKVRGDLIKQSRELPDGERTEFVATKLADWDLANPLDSYTRPQTKKKAAARTTEFNVKPEVNETLTNDNSDLSIDQLRSAVGKPMAQETDTSKTDTTSDDVLTVLSNKMGGGDAKKIGKLISDKNMVIVDDASEVPGNAQENGAGFYDGKRTYIVANKLNKKNIMGELLSVAAHEVKHAADVAGDAKLKGSIGNFIGESANKALIKKIEGLAKVDRGVAKVVEAAQKAGNYDLELPAYFINYSLAKQDAKGPVSRIAGNIVSAIRTSFGGDVNLNDVAYMSKKLLKEAAVAGESLESRSLNKTLPMFVSGGWGASKAKAEGRTYKSADGKTKYEVSDNESSVNLPEDLDDRTYKLSQILKHGKLYAELPQLRSVGVKFISRPELNIWGAYSPNDNMIYLNMSHLGAIDGPSIGEFGSKLHRTLLHETQHAAQRVAGSTGGAMAKDFLPPEAKSIELEIGALDQQIHKAIDEFDVDRMTKLRQEKMDLQNRMFDMENEAEKKYYSVLGEQEAHATADRLELTQEERDQEAGMMENKFLRQNGRILKSNGKVLAEKEGPTVLAYTPDMIRNALDSVSDPKNKLYTILKTQFRGFGGLERKLGVMKENADGFAARSSHRAMNYYARINEGISRIARREVKEGLHSSVDQGRKAVAEMIEGRLQAIAKIEDVQRREAAVAAISREYPELRSLVEAIGEVNELSRSILAQMIEANPNPTPAELKKMNTIHRNMFRYSTRLYAAFQGDPGRERSRRLVKEYEKGRDALASKGEVPAKFRESFETYLSGMKYIIDHDITIPEDMDGAKQDRIDQLYDTWINEGSQRAKALLRAEAANQGLKNEGAVQAFVREAMVQKLQERREQIDQTQYEAAANDIIRGMLELEESSSPFASYYRGFKQDRGILMEREHISPEIRKLLGEITDPATRLAITISKQGELVGRTKLLLDMKEQGNGRWVMPAVDARLPGNEKFSATLEGENWGPLQGWRATPEVARSIGDTVEMVQTLSDALARSYQNTDAIVSKVGIGAARGLVKGASVAKMLSVVFEPFGMVANGIGSVVVPLANGVVNPKHYVSGAKVGAEVVLDTLFDGKGKLTPAFEDAVRWGILDSARVQEIRRTPQEFVRKLISDKPKAVSKALTAGRLGKNTAIEMFAMSDAWAKITAFHDRVDVLSKFYEAEGIEKSENEIKSEAADNIKDTNITYGRTVAAVRNLESTGLTTFLPYFYSVPRAITYGYIQAAKDIVRANNATTPEGKAVMAKSGIQRLAGNTVATVGIVAAMKAAAAAINGDDEEKVEEMKKLMPPDARFSDSVYLGKDELGNPLFARLSRVDAYGPLNDVLRVMADDTLTPAQKSKATTQMISDLLFVNRFTKSVIGLAGDLTNKDVEVKDKTTRIERVAPGASEKIKDWMLKIPKIDENDAESALAVLDSFSPGWLDAIDPSNRVVKDAKSGDAKALGDLIVGMGGRLDRADPGLAAYVAGAELKDVRDAGRSRIAKGVLADRSADSMEDLFLEYAHKEYDAMRAVGDVYDGMVDGVGMTPREASAILKDKANLTAADIAGLRQGRILQEADSWINQSSRMLSKASMEQRVGKNPMTPEQKKELDERIERFQKNMKALGYKVQE